MASIFTKIVNGDIPCYKIAETVDFFAFLDINPLTKGHTLAIPKIEVDYIFDLDHDIYIGLNLFVYEISKAIKNATNCERIGTAVVGFEVPHTHIHVVPMNKVSDLNFDNKRLSLTQEELESVASEIRDNLNKNS